MRNLVLKNLFLFTLFTFSFFSSIYVNNKKRNLFIKLYLLTWNFSKHILKLFNYDSYSDIYDKGKLTNNN